MSREPIYPDQLYDSRKYYSQGIRSTGRTTIYCSGQAPIDKAGNVVGVGDIGAQCRQGLQNIRTLIECAGATIDEIVALRIYAVRHKPEYLDIVGNELVNFFGHTPLPVSTWIGVEALALPEFLIELEAVVVCA